MKNRKIVSLILAITVFMASLSINGFSVNAEESTVKPGDSMTITNWSRTREPATTDAADSTHDVQKVSEYRKDNTFKWQFSVLDNLIKKMEADNKHGIVWDYNKANQIVHKDNCGSSDPGGAKLENGSWVIDNNLTGIDAATWLNVASGDGSGSARLFRAEFEWPEGYDLKDTLALVTTNKSNYQGIYDYLNEPGNESLKATYGNSDIIAINDDMFVFIHSANTKLTAENLNKYLVFWSGTSASNSSYKYNGESAATAFHKVFPGGTGSYTKTNGTVVNFANTVGNKMSFSDQWYTFANPNNFTSVLNKNYKFDGAKDHVDSDEYISPGEKIYVDILCFDYSGWGGIDKLDLQLTRRDYSAQQVTINYYLDTVSADSKLGTSYVNGIMPGTQYQVAVGSADGQLNRFYNAAIAEAGMTVKDGKQVSFPVIVEPYSDEDTRNTINVVYETNPLSETSYVIDYVDSDRSIEFTEDSLFANDNLSGEVSTCFRNEDNTSALNKAGAYGTLTINADESYKYRLDRFFNGIDKFTLETSITGSGTTTTKNKYVNIIPANNIYYEDTFVSTDDDADDATSLGIVYSGTWTTDGSSAGNQEAVNSSIHGGWQNADFADDQTYSDGSAHKTTVSSTTLASASFKFTGTGVDIYSRTNMTTGTVTATLVGTSGSGKRVAKAIAVDQLAESGDYYQIPTLYFGDLEFGTYTVTIYVTSAAGPDRCTYYLDGIRVYNPVFNLESTNSSVQQAYGNETNAVFTSVRDKLLTANSFTNGGTSNEAEKIGFVFIDKKSDGTTVGGTTDQVISEYQDYGPKNEVYLAPGQSIIFKADTNIIGKTYHLGLKVPSSTAVEGVAAPENGENVLVTEGTGNKALKVTGASDSYYQITPNADGIVMVKNTGNTLLSVTKLKTIGSGYESAAIMSISEDEAVTYARTFSTLKRVDIEKPDEGDVTINNPDKDDINKEILSIVAKIRKLVSNIFGGFKLWFHS